MTSDEIQSKLEDCSEAKTCKNSPFSKWESDFLDSIAEWFSDHGELSEKQEEMLEKIWDKI